MRLVLDVGKKYPEITGPISDAFVNELRRACESGDYTELILDFKGTSMVSSMALGSIFAAYQQLKDKGISLSVINASDKIDNLMRTVRMGELIGVS